MQKIGFIAHARAGDFGAIDFSGVADVLCNFAKIDKPRLPKGWRPA